VSGLSILFVAYILAQVPSNLLLNHLGKPSLYLGFFVCAWGLVSALTSQVKSYGGIVACRFMLGLVGERASVDRVRPYLGLSTDLIQRRRSLPACCFICPNGTPKKN